MVSFFQQVHRCETIIGFQHFKADIFSQHVGRE